MSTQPQPLCLDSQAEPPSPSRSSGNDPHGRASSLERSTASMPPPVRYSQQQHRALTIPEIVGLICEHLEVLAEPHHEGSGTRRNLEDLAALARTCRDFENPALDILWREQNTLANTLKCLPSNLWEETLVPNDGSYCLRLTSAAQGAEWDRPLAHARRVRRLILDEWSSPYAFPDRDLLEIISSSLPQEYLFPNLRSIRLEPHDDAELSFIPLFAGPQLTDITLSVDMSASGILLLPTLDLRYQQLTTLCIETFPREPGVCASTSKIALNLDRVEILALDKLDLAALEYLGQLPSLRSLTLHTPDLLDLGRPFLSPNPQTPHSSFQALRTIQLSRTTFDFAIECINLFSGTGCHLEEFVVGSEVLATQITAENLYAAIAGGLSHTHLQTLNISNLNDGVSETPTPLASASGIYVISGHILTPLYPFTNLAVLILVSPVGFDIGDAAAWDMAPAWPNLVRLVLESATEVHYPSTMTLHGLRAFAEHCKALKFLAITVNGFTVPPLDNSPQMRIPQRQFCSFDVAKSPISDARTVSRFLFSLFPDLSEIRTHDEGFWRIETQMMKTKKPPRRVCITLGGRRSKR
ncbi:hypothetical protein B0H14DRAFT_3852974 [Mycena olivaceomarginata]|nr:hypothetical protein B0H14DRAFT_3852974 [Mycena olivaceomarginata]